MIERLFTIYVPADGVVFGFVIGTVVPDGDDGDKRAAICARLSVVALLRATGVPAG